MYFPNPFRKQVSCPGLLGCTPSKPTVHWVVYVPITGTVGIFEGKKLETRVSGVQQPANGAPVSNLQQLSQLVTS